jgi:hypothetical protein
MNKYEKSEAEYIALHLGYAKVDRSDRVGFISFADWNSPEKLCFNLRTGYVWLDLCLDGISLSSKRVHCHNEKEFQELRKRYKNYVNACILV